MRWLKRIVIGMMSLVIGLLVLTLATAGRGDPSLYPPVPGQAAIRVHVVDHGWHTGLVVRVADLSGAALRLGLSRPVDSHRLRWLASRYPHAEWLELGWGDAVFYQATPGIADVDPWLGLRALAVPTPSALQVVPGEGRVAALFARSQVLPLELSQAGFDALAIGLAATLPEVLPNAPIGPSLYGGGVFYTARLDYHLLRTCNRWVADLLAMAGVPISPVPGSLSAGLMAELRVRAR